VDFFEASELFVNIFQNLGPNCKFLDCGLILENRGASLQNGGEFRPGFIFQRINLWTGSMPPCTGRARSIHRGPTAARIEGGAGRGGALIGARPSAAPVCQSSPAGAQ
jgi:hypothetical protein